MWHAIAAAFAFGLSGFLGTRLAARVYANDAPLADGPVPAPVPTAVLVALATVVGALVTLRTASLVACAVACVVVAALCAAIFTDTTRGFIGDWFTLPPLALAIVLGAVRGELAEIGLCVALVTAPFAGAALLSKGMGMGWGDVKLVALGSAVLDIRTAIVVYSAACVAACAVALARRRGSEPIAFAPYLAGAIAAGIVAG